MSPNQNRGNGLVSVCLPVYNGERYLQTAIQSILAQSYEHFELIIFDDFSTDRSLAIIEEFAAQDSRIHHWRNGRRLGLFETYNQCLGQANGEYIKLFSQADLLHSQALESCVMQLESEPKVALVTVGYELIDARGGPLKNPDKEWTKEAFKPFRPVPSAEILEKCLFPLVNYLGEASTVMFRSAFQGSGFDTRLHQYAELDYWLRIIMHGDCIRLPEAYAHIRHHLGSSAVANSRNLMGACDLIKISRKFSRVIEACGRSEEEFLDQSIAAYVAEIQIMVADGTIASTPLRRADDLRSRAAMNSAHETSASATAAFSALASALIGGDVSAVSFQSEPNASGQAMLEDLIDFREFSFHAIRMLSQIALPGSPSLNAPRTNKIVVAKSENSDGSEQELSDKVNEMLESAAFEPIEMDLYEPDLHDFDVQSESNAPTGDEDIVLKTRKGTLLPEMKVVEPAPPDMRNTKAKAKARNRSNNSSNPG